MTIETQIRNLVQDIDDAQSPITGMAIRSATPVVEPAPGRRMPALGWATVAAAMIAVLLIPILFLGGPETDVATTVSPTTIPLRTVEWQTISFDGVDGPLYGEVKAGDGRFLVLQYGAEGRGTETNHPVDLDGDPRTILWTSVDGTAWDAHVIDVAEGSRPALIGEIDGAVLIQQFEYDDGTFEYEPGKTGSFVVYRSEDLVTWSEVDFGEMQWTAGSGVIEFRSYIWDVAATETAVLLIGNSPPVLTDAALTRFELLDAPFGRESDGHPVMPLQLIATSSSFHAVTYSNDREVFGIWSSTDGRTWTEEQLDGELRGDGPEPVIGANDETLVVFAGFGRSFVGSPGDLRRIDDLYATGDDMHLIGGDDGFILLGASGFGDGDSIWSVGPYVSVDGEDWSSAPLNGAHIAGWHTVRVGEWILAPTGSWEVETAGSEVIGESWIQDGGWVLGRLIPAG
jgi:hypothetical protein